MIKKIACPCCGFITIPDDGTFPGSFYICPVCYWEDDGVQFDEPDFRGGANKMSLNEARETYKRIGAVDAKFLKHVRPPEPSEVNNS